MRRRNMRFPDRFREKERFFRVLILLIVIGAAIFVLRGRLWAILVSVLNIFACIKVYLSKAFFLLTKY